MNNEIISISQQVLSGTPVFKGTRVPIKHLFDYLETGESIDDFLTGFPSVRREQAIGLLEMAEDQLTTSEVLHENPA